MMRPTTSSASKTTEKIITPPRAKTTTRPTTREGPASHKPHQGLKGSPSTKKLPSAAKEIKKEGSSAAHSGEREGPIASTGGSNQAEQAAPAKDETKIPATAGDEPVAAPSNENKPIEEMLAKEDFRVAAEPEIATETAVDAERHAEQTITSEEHKSTAETAKSVNEGSSAAEPVIHEEPEKPAEATVKSEEPIVSDKPKVAVPPVEITGDHAATNDVSQQSKEESKAEDTVTAT
jgi:hypothetical protein